MKLILASLAGLALLVTSANAQYVEQAPGRNYCQIQYICNNGGATLTVIDKNEVLVYVRMQNKAGDYGLNANTCQERSRTCRNGGRQWHD